MANLLLKALSVAVLVAAMAFAGALIALIEQGVSAERGAVPAGSAAGHAAAAPG
ncbi:hypothetical protein [Caldovatus aquaticus]|uniref:Uncharacterized protein n=1 Tax=Caldovatus aquaticus TaxID=2865671 RepID=A0ABS7F5G0_9PROT|nr:hypothetical protein [Caldovatus aquaticus]MBW8270840.1 hypothetical protein [Caldovatus aquaticus]